MHRRLNLLLGAHVTKAKSLQKALEKFVHKASFEGKFYFILLNVLPLP